MLGELMRNHVRKLVLAILSTYKMEARLHSVQSFQAQKLVEI